MSGNVYLYQVVYSDQILQELEPGYLVLDNRKNARPDWREYWPIRHFLRTQPLEDDALYGFFSPKFASKTRLSYVQTRDRIAESADQADIILFSPQPDMGCFFLNVFEQAEVFDSGLIEAFEAFLEHIGQPAKVGGLVMDSRQIVFSNFFVAKPPFWRTWFELTERFFEICEGPDTELKRQLTQPTSYPDNVERKVFLMERIASYLLCTQPQWRSRSVDPFPFVWSTSRFRDFPDEAIISDALKLAYLSQGFPEYLQAFGRIRKRCFGSTPK